ncbi:MAG: gamma carbonic anhydrase family protein [Elusimicrobiota bacterium]
MIKELGDRRPRISESVYIDETAQVIGDVILEKNVSVWSYVVLRGNVSRIQVCENSNIQDGTIIHTNYEMPTLIGKNVTVGHGAILHGCSIKDNCLIGMGAVLLDGCEIDEFSIIAASSLVPEGRRLSSGVYMGTPAIKVRDINHEDRSLIEKRALEYVGFNKEFRDNGW